MFKFLQEIIWGPAEESQETLEDAFKILARAEEEENPKVSISEEEDGIQKYQIKNELGTITKAGNNSYEIDNKYNFASENLFTRGTKVSYTLYKEGNVVGNVKEIIDEWGAESVKTGDSSWCLRTINVQVVSKSGRRLIADPGNIEIDLNQTKSEFIPIVGDFLELETKSEIDENVLNLNGKILEIIKVRPVRAQIKEGVIKCFNEKRYTGIVNRDIFFNKEALLNGYIPKVGDKVVVEIIESNQFDHLWRAVKVMLQSSVQNSKSNQFGNLNKLPTYEHSLDGVKISDNVMIEAKNFNESHTFQISVTNEKYEDVNLKEITVEGSMQQTKLQSSKPRNQVIAPSQTVDFNFCVVAKSSGKSREIILFHFDTAIVGRLVSITLAAVDVPQIAATTGFVHRNTQYDYMKKRSQLNYGQVIRGEQLKEGPRFTKKFNDWRVPRNLINMYSNFKDLSDLKQNLTDELIRIKPCMAEPLSLHNYEDRFHTLLYLEELHHIMCMRRYDLERACFIVDGSFLILEMPGLAESRPSVIVGDKVMATCLANQTVYEGFVHKSMGNHLKLKFAPMFHQQYKGEDYEIHVQSSRSPFKRGHQGIFLAVKDMADLLFPNHILKKKPQVKFTYEPYDDIICTSGTKMKIREAPVVEIKDAPKKRISKVDLIRKMQSTKSPASLATTSTTTTHEDDTNGAKPKPIKTKLILSPPPHISKTVPKKFEYKLEWFDKSLNYYQKEAVRNILLGESRPLPYIIFGPPGTGKSVTIIECILQILRMISHSRLLIATPSNSAADLLTMRLIGTGSLHPGDLVRLVSFKALQEDLIPTSIIPYCATASIAREGTISGENSVTDKGYVSDMTMSAIGRHRITIGTCNALGALQYTDFKKGHFTHIIVDEAGQCTEPEIMIPMSHVDTTDGQIIMAGDPMQLGPVVISEYAKSFGLEETYMDRLIHRFPYIRDTTGFPQTGGYDPRLVTKLLYNYRALPELLTISNSCFYHSELRATISETDSDEAEFLKGLSDMLPVTVEGKVPSLVFHGINGINQRGDDFPSWYNPDEASQVFFYINELYRMGVSKKDIGVITPYIKQVRQIREILIEAGFEVPKVGTVEEFQGLEYKVIIISTVRSCPDDLDFDKRYVLGFITNPRRFNVAITRSQCLTIVIANPNLLQGDRHWGLVLAYCRKNGTYVGCEIK